jgi:isoaspartyl peptidase/L-asparaginase-like protein (Ntn-hydrolase superfamily)
VPTVRGTLAGVRTRCPLLEAAAAFQDGRARGIALAYPVRACREWPGRPPRVAETGTVAVHAAVALGFLRELAFSQQHLMTCERRPPPRAHSLHSVYDMTKRTRGSDMLTATAIARDTRGHAAREK